MTTSCVSSSTWQMVLPFSCLPLFKVSARFSLPRTPSTSCSSNRYALKSPWRKSLSQALSKTVDNRFSSEWHFSPSTFTLSSWSLTPQHNRADNTDFQLEFSVAFQKFSLLQINSYLSSSSKQISRRYGNNSYSQISFHQTEKSSQPSA